MLIQYLTRRFKNAANQYDSTTVVEAGVEGLPNDHQPATKQLSHEPHVAAKEISQLACNQ